MLEDFCREWAQDDTAGADRGGGGGAGRAGGVKVFPEGTREADAEIRLIVDPIDGTRGLMYDKRPAWALAGVAPNKGPGRRCGISKSR